MSATLPYNPTGAVPSASAGELLRAAMLSRLALSAAVAARFYRTSHMCGKTHVQTHKDTDNVRTLFLSVCVYTHPLGGGGTPCRLPAPEPVTLLAEVFSFFLYP